MGRVEEYPPLKLMGTSNTSTGTRTDSSKTHTSYRSNKRVDKAEIQQLTQSEVSERWADFAAGRPGSQQLPDLINLGSKDDDLFSFSPTTPIPTTSKSMQPISLSSSSSPKLNQIHHAKDDLDELLH